MRSLHAGKMDGAAPLPANKQPDAPRDSSLVTEKTRRRKPTMSHQALLIQFLAAICNNRPFAKYPHVPDSLTAATMHLCHTSALRRNSLPLDGQSSLVLHVALLAPQSRSNTSPSETQCLKPTLFQKLRRRELTPGIPRDKREY